MTRLNELVKEMFEVLDTVKMSNHGKEYHPTYITGDLDDVKIVKVLEEMREIINRPPPPKLRTADEIDPTVCPWCHGTGDRTNHERYSDDCSLCERSGRVKVCPICSGNTHRENECSACDGIGLVANKDW